MVGVRPTASSSAKALSACTSSSSRVLGPLGTSEIRVGSGTTSDAGSDPRFGCAAHVADHQHQELVRTHKREGRPRSDECADEPVGETMRRVRSNGRGDTEAQQPAGKGGNGSPTPRRVQHHHRAGVDQAIDGQRHEAGCQAVLAIAADDVEGVAVGDNRCNGGDADHRNGGRPSDEPVRVDQGNRNVRGGLHEWVAGGTEELLGGPRAAGRRPTARFTAVSQKVETAPDSGVPSWTPDGPGAP